MASTRAQRVVDRWRRRSGRYYHDPRAYWEARHREHGDGLRGVGCVLLDEAGNSRDYDTKWAHVAAILEHEAGRGARRILDAGCGVGWFTQHLSMVGFTDVDAFDFSATAAAQAGHRVPSARVVVGALEEFRSARPYDVVMCIDVLFHVVDDDRWSRALSNLASLVAPGGALLVQDSIAATGEEQPASHVRIRPVEWYCSLLEEWNLESLDAYDLPAEMVGKHLMLFRR